MNFRNNLDTGALIGNVPIQIDFGDGIVVFKTPTIKEYYYDLEFFQFLAIMKLTPETYNKDIDAQQFIADSNYDAFSAALKFGFKKEMVIRFFHKYFTNLQIKEDMIFIGDREITAEEYDALLDVMLISCGEKELDSISLKEETELEKRIREKEEKIKKIKAEKDKSSKTITIDQIVVALLFEFEALSITDIFNMNVFTFNYFWNKVPEVVNERIMSGAASAGHAENYSHFTNRGEKK